MPRPLRALLVEDSEDDAFFVLRALKEGGFDPEYARVESIRGLTAALEGHDWEVVICDHALPGFSSFDALELIKSRGLEIPVIIVSGVIGEEQAVQAMKAGAGDYVMKASLTRLAPAIEREMLAAANRAAQRDAERALQQSERELNDFFENAPAGMHWSAEDGAILRANAAEIEMLGWDAEEFLGRSVADLFVDKEAGQQALETLRAGRPLTDFDAQWRHHDGAILEVRINANAFRDGDKFIRSRWFVSDVTERKEGERAMAYLGAIVEGSEDAVIGMSREGNIVSWNRGAEQLYGYAAGEAIGKSAHTMVPGSRVDEPLDFYAQLMAGNAIGRHESVRVKKNGDTVPVSVTLSPIRDASGAVIGVSAIEKDITARKEEELERLELIRELSKALAGIKTLRGLLPICASCKRIRDEKGSWKQIEAYVADHTQAEFTHGLCPECKTQVIAEMEATR